MPMNSNTREGAAVAIGKWEVVRNKSFYAGQR